MKKKKSKYTYIRVSKRSYTGRLGGSKNCKFCNKIIHWDEIQSKFIETNTTTIHKCKEIPRLKVYTRKEINEYVKNKKNM